MALQAREYLAPEDPSTEHNCTYSKGSEQFRPFEYHNQHSEKKNPKLGSAGGKAEKRQREGQLAEGRSRP